MHHHRTLTVAGQPGTTRHASCLRRDAPAFLPSGASGRTLRALFLGLTLLLGLSWASAPAEAGDGMAILGLLPENTALVITLDLERGRKSPAGKRLLPALTSSELLAGPLGKLEKQAGLSIQRDVKTVVLAMASDFEESKDVVVVAEGRFAQSKIVAVAKAESKTFAKLAHRGTTYYVLDDDTALAFLGRHAVLTPKKTITKVIDVFRRKAPAATKNRAYMSLVKSGDTKKDVWAGFLVPTSLRGEIAKETGGHSIDAFMASVDMQSGVAVRVGMDVSTEEGATAIATLVQSGVAEARNSPEVVALGLDSALTRIKVAVTKKHLDLALDLSADELDRLSSTLENELAGKKE